MRKLYSFFITVFLLLHVIVSQAQLQGVSLQSTAACGGATLETIAQWSGAGTRPVTFYIEKQVSGVSWATVSTQPYDVKGNYLLITPADISTATFYRVRGIDEVNGQEFTSAAVSVNPATWNNDRGTAFVTVTPNWGRFCNNSENYIEVLMNYSIQGRPPFKVEYKRVEDANYLLSGTAMSWMWITGILPNTNYNVRVTDFCGKVTQLNAKLTVGISTFLFQDATTCNNGKVRVEPVGVSQYRGIPPYKYGIGKVTADMVTIIPEITFRDADVFDSLPPGDYYFQLQDACGNLSNTSFLRMGGGFPLVSIPQITIGADSCSRNITVISVRGTQPLQYGIQGPGDPQIRYQSSNVFTGLNQQGIYYTYARDLCGQVSKASAASFSIPAPVINSVSRSSTGSACIKDLIVKTSNTNKPYQYGIRTQYNGAFVYQASDTFKNVGKGIFEIRIKDKCDHESAIFTQDESTTTCDLLVTPGDVESAGLPQGCPDFSGHNWIDALDAAGHLIFSINPQDNVLQQVCWGVRILPTTDTMRTSTYNGQPTFIMDRNFYIEPAVTPVLSKPVQLRLFVSHSDIDFLILYLKTHGFPNATAADIRILKKKGSAGSPVDLEVSNDVIASSSQFTVITPTLVPFGDDWYMEFSINDFSEFHPYSSSAATLPLHLLSFSGRQATGKVVLQWVTTGEVNTSRFDIEWSSDGNHFSVIGHVASANTNGTHTYAFDHLTAAAQANYYRLKQVDKDERFTYSKVVKVVANDAGSITISPNPASEVLSVQLPTGNDLRTLRIVDASGRLLLQKKVPAGSAKVEVDIHALTKGWYILQLVGSTSIQQSFIKN